MFGVILGVKSHETLGFPFGRLPVPKQDRVTELPRVVMVEGRGSSVKDMFGSEDGSQLYFTAKRILHFLAT
jgi:hypothetical protein